MTEAEAGRSRGHGMAEAEAGRSRAQVMAEAEAKAKAKAEDEARGYKVDRGHIVPVGYLMASSRPFGTPYQTRGYPWLIV